MPADFDKCVRDGGRVRTIAVKGQPNKYMHVCYDEDGKSHSGEVKTKKASELFLKNLVTSQKITKAFSEPKSVIDIMHAGEWEHPQYGTIRITDDDIDKFVNSFNSKVRKVDIAVDQEHMPEKGAAGWFKSLKKVVEDGVTKLKASVEWTKLGQDLIKDGVFKYFSPEFDFSYEDMETHEEFENVLLGGALTNRPYFKSLAPVAFSENLYAGFTSNFNEKGGEKKMTKEELKAKLAEDPDFKLAEDASEEDKKSFEEAKSELAKEAEDGEEGDEEENEDEEDSEDEEEDESVKGSENFISRADHTKQMNEMKSKLGVVEKKLKFKEVQEEVAGYVFSESNPNGVLLPKNKKLATDILMSANGKTAKLFKEFLSELPAVSKKLFQEEGSGDAEDAKDGVQAEAQKLVDEGKAKTYGEAIKQLHRSKPDLFK